LQTRRNGPHAWCQLPENRVWVVTGSAGSGTVRTARARARATSRPAGKASRLLLQSQSYGEGALAQSHFREFTVKTT
jgi:hypothetical protein